MLYIIYVFIYSMGFYYMEISMIYCFIDYIGSIQNTYLEVYFLYI